MSVDAVLARIAELQVAASPLRRLAPVTGTAGTTATASGSFAAQLAATAAPPAALGALPLAGGSPAERMVAAAQAEVGQAEMPPGSNDSPRIAEYRSATSGGGVGPWCSYFVSWAARGAGVPLGEMGQGFASVSAVDAWAQRTGRSIPAGPGVRPNPGDLVLWGGRHIGMVESVDPDGSVHTIEGNSSDQVSRRAYGPDAGGATSYVRVG